MPRLVGVAEAAAAIGRLTAARWADALCAELGVGEPVRFEVALRPGVRSGAAVERVGLGAWQGWREEWEAAPGVVRATVRIRGVDDVVPDRLAFADVVEASEFAAAHGITSAPSPVDLLRARALAAELHARSSLPGPAALRRVVGLDDADQRVLLDLVDWLATQPDLSRFSLRQLPVPGMHTKWLERHSGLVTKVTGRDVLAEVRPRPAVVHLTYLDPDANRSGRRHDSWTAGDTHDLAYRPSVVVIVENRDCRLWFPATVPHGVVVEGGGAAAVATLAQPESTVSLS